MAHRWVIVGICGLVIGSLLPLFRASGINFTPAGGRVALPDPGQAAGRLEPRRDQSLMERIARDIREQLPGVTDTLSFPGGGGGGFGQTNAGSLFVRLKPIDERELRQQELIARARGSSSPTASRR